MANEKAPCHHNCCRRGAGAISPLCSDEEHLKHIRLVKKPLQLDQAPRCAGEGAAQLLITSEVPGSGCRCPWALVQGRLCIHDAIAGRPPRGSQPHTCGLCARECQCACGGCYPASDKERECGGRRRLKQCECRKLSGGRCKHAIFSYASESASWFCGLCTDDYCSCRCPGCREGTP